MTMHGKIHNLVGYDEEIQSPTLFGFSGLRFGKRVQPGHVLTNEPGIYFIPELIEQWESVIRALVLSGSGIRGDILLSHFHLQTKPSGTPCSFGRCGKAK